MQLPQLHTQVQEERVMKERTQWLIAALFIMAFIVMTTFGSLIGFVTDYLWFKDIGYIQTFLVKLITYLKIGIPVFVASFLIFYFYVRSLKKKYYRISGNVSSSAEDKQIHRMIAGGSVFLALIFTSYFTRMTWFEILQFINRTSFNIADPIYQKDIAFYIFQLPLFRNLLNLALSFTILMVIITVLFHALIVNVKKPNEGTIYDINELRSRKDVTAVFNKNIFVNAIMKIGILGFMVFVIIGVTNILSIYDLLYSPRGVAYGASYTDIHVSLPGFQIKAVISFIGAITILVGAHRRQWKLMSVGPIALLIAAILIGGIGAGVQQFIVEPDERSKEREFLEYNISYTQMAFNLDKIQEKEFPVEQKLDQASLEVNEETIQNIRINDYRPLKQTYNNLQGIRLYYQFNDIDIDRYMINDKYTQVFLAAREMNQEKLEVKTWINEHLQFTHGYGVALSPVNAVTVDGQPQLLMKNIPPLSSTDLRIEQPEIYFGEMTNNYIVVKGSDPEFDYPKGSDNVYTTYEGEAGIPLSFMNRLLFAVREGSMKLLLADSINAESQIVINRNIQMRLKKIMPYIRYDSDPYIVINQENGKLYWIIDGYTVDDKYPYSQPYPGSAINYMRNSVKVVVDAYNGETDYYIFDETDPVVNTYSKIFKDLFKHKDEMPEGLKAHTRYPKHLFEVQSEVYRIYHVENPDVFYNGEDIWDIGIEKYMGSNEQRVQGNYMMFKLPEEESVEYLLTIPFTPKSKPNMTSLFVARNDGVNYGKLFIYRFPKDRTIYGPQMIESRIDQNTDISQQLTFWDQKGSAVLRGNLLTIPIDNSLLYIEPIYLQAENERSLPEMKRVIVAYKEKIVMEETLAEGLAKIFGIVETEVRDDTSTDTQTPSISDGSLDEKTAQELLDQANALFENSQGSLDDLKEVLDKLNELINEPTEE